MVVSVVLPDQICPTSRWPSLEDALTASLTQVMSAKAGVESLPEATLAEACAWLKSFHLLKDGESSEVAIRRHKALSKCKFGTGVDETTKGGFLRRLVPYEQHLAAKQTDIGNVRDLKYHY